MNDPYEKSNANSWRRVLARLAGINFIEMDEYFSEPVFVVEEEKNKRLFKIIGLGFIWVFYTNSGRFLVKKEDTTECWSGSWSGRSITMDVLEGRRLGDLKGYLGETCCITIDDASLKLKRTYEPRNEELLPTILRQVLFGPEIKRKGDEEILSKSLSGIFCYPKIDRTGNRKHFDKIIADFHYGSITFSTRLGYSGEGVARNLKTARDFPFTIYNSHIIFDDVPFLEEDLKACLDTITNGKVTIDSNRIMIRK